MELNPIREIRAFGVVRVPKVEADIEPPYAFNPAARMEDDAYKRNDRAAERGLEEDASETDEDADTAATDSDDPDSTVDVLA